MPNEVKQNGHEALVKVFGIKNCDTCRQALKWLDSKAVPHRFQYVRDTPPSQGLVELWSRSSFSDRLVNRRSTTWRGLNGRQRASALDNPVPALLEHPTLLKRPVFMRGRDVLAVGFFPEELAKTLEGTQA